MSSQETEGSDKKPMEESSDSTDNDESEEVDEFAFPANPITNHQRKVLIGLRKDSLKIFRTNVLLAGSFFPLTAVFLQSETSTLTMLFQNNNITSAMVSMTLSIGFAFLTYVSASDALNKAIPLDELSSLAEQSDKGGLVLQQKRQIKY